MIVAAALMVSVTGLFVGLGARPRQGPHNPWPPPARLDILEAVARVPMHDLDRPPGDHRARSSACPSRASP